MEVPLHEGFPVEPRSRLSIREAAIHAREVLRLPPGRLNIPRLLDDLTRFGIYYDVFDRHSAPVPREVEACYVPEMRTLYIRDSVFQQMCDGGQRAVFTVGHELGHAVLAHRRTLNRQTTATFPRYCNSEWQANAFAAEFTMPLAEIWKFGLFTPEAIARYFGVSMAAARIRQQDLETRKELKKKP
ncbi:MAG: ImmA/IrrE family metallo-endopeptidase [Leptothrix sp. (in: b-proteobacteria)]